MRRLILTALAACTLMVTALVGSAGAITDGELDGNGHPYVGLMIAKNAAGAPMWRCSGTLLSPTLFLTAGHCTEAPAAKVEIWFYNNETQIRANGYPHTGQVSGTPHVHPGYDPNAFYLRDLGAVVLDTPFPMAKYGKLPQLNELERMANRRGQQDVTFTAVGYGLQQINPAFFEARLDRMVASPKLNQINTGLVGDFSVLLSNNASTGGTCFGDSGGPNFIGTSNVVGGVTSFGLNGTCGGTGGVFRMDRSWSLDWITSTFGAHLP